MQRGAEFWTAKRDEFYASRGLFYEEDRKIPRDPDISNLRRVHSVDEEYMRNYPRAYSGKGSVAKQRENFDKWLLLPGRYKSSEEETANIIRLLNRAKALHEKKAAEAAEQVAKDIDEEEKRVSKSAKRVESRRRKSAAAKEAEAKSKAVEEAVHREILVTPVASAVKSSTSAKKGGKKTRKEVISLSDDDDEEEELVLPVRAKAQSTGNGRKSKANYYSPEAVSINDSSKGSSTLSVPVPSAQPSSSSAPPPQLLTIRIETSSSISSSATTSMSSNSNAVVVPLGPEQHASDLIGAYKLEQAKLSIQKAKELDALKMREHEFRMRRDQENLDLKSKKHDVQTQETQRQLHVTNMRNQVFHDQQSRFYNQMRQEADTNELKNAMARDNANTSNHIQRQQWTLQKDIQEWQDDRQAKSSREFRQNVERDGHLAYQREDATRRQTAQNTWYSGAADTSNNSARQPNNQRSTQWREHKKERGGKRGTSSKKRNRHEDEDDEDESADSNEDEEDNGSDGDKLVTAPFNPLAKRK